MFLILSCEKESSDLIDDLGLVGKWKETIDAQPQGLLIYDLTLNNNAIISLKISHFGVYFGESDQDLSAWSEFSGSFEQEDPNFLILKSQRYTWWDGFYDMVNPIIEESNTLVFENCTYKIKNNVLELTYTTYPADAPIETKKELVRVQ